MDLSGKLILVVASSGSGKGVLIDHIRNCFPEYVYPVAFTTRAMRPGDVDGAVYHFISREDFEVRITSGDFLEHAEFGGNLYGTPRQEIMQALAEGKIVIREVESQGAAQIKISIPKENLKILFIDAGDWSHLEKRIIARAPIAADELERRRLHYEHEREFMSESDYVIKNEDGKLEDAKQSIEEVVRLIIEA